MMEGHKAIIIAVILVTVIFSGFFLYEKTQDNKPSTVIGSEEHTIVIHQTVFIDQVRHNSISYTNGNTGGGSNSLNPNNFVITYKNSCDGACEIETYSLATYLMQCDDLAKWWNSHNDNDDDEVWAEITKLGCK